MPGSTTTCATAAGRREGALPRSSRPARGPAARPPIRAPSFAALARGAIRRRGASRGRSSSSGGDPAVGADLDPAAGGGDACVEVPAALGARHRELPLEVDRDDRA